MTADRLLQDLERAYTEHRLDRRLRIYLAPQGLIVDEFGYLPLSRVAATLLSPRPSSTASSTTPTWSTSAGTVTGSKTNAGVGRGNPHPALTGRHNGHRVDQLRIGRVDHIHVGPDRWGASVCDDPYRPTG